MNRDAVNQLRTTEQNKLLHPICRDLASQLQWHGMRLSSDDWRGLLCASIRQARIVPAISFDGRPAGVVALTPSSRSLSKAEMTELITLALHLGDHPEEYGAGDRPVKWSDIVLLAIGFNPNDFQE